MLAWLYAGVLVVVETVLQLSAVLMLFFVFASVCYLLLSEEVENKRDSAPQIM